MPPPDVEPFHLHVRRRPGMYVGGTNGRGIRHMIDDIIDEQLAAPRAKIDRVTVAVLAEGFIEVHVAGSVGDVDLGDFTTDYRSDGPGPHLMSLTIAAAMSDRLDAEIARAGRREAQSFGAGVPLGPPRGEPCDAGEGLRVRFRPDPALFKDAAPRHLALCGLIGERAIFHPAVRFRVENRTAETTVRDFHYPGGLLSYVEEVDHEWIDFRPDARLWHLRSAGAGDRAEAVVLYRGVGPPVLHSFVNGRRSPEHGTHVDGFRRAISDVATRSPGPWPVRLRRRDDPLEYMTVLLAAWVADETWGDSVKMRLRVPSAEALVYDMVASQLPPLLAAGAQPE